MASKKPSGLGRGLGALLGDDVLKTESSGSLSLPLSQVESCSSQPRKLFDEAALAELADSIREHGIIQPLTVRKLSSGYYQIIAGERRWRAARLAGLAEVPAIVIEADDRKAAELAMIENLQREDLNPMEEAAGFQSLIENYHMTQEEAAQRVGKSRSAVANALRLLGLTPTVRRLVEDGQLSAGHARALLPLSSAAQESAASAVVSQQFQRGTRGHRQRRHRLRCGLRRSVRAADRGPGKASGRQEKGGSRHRLRRCGLYRRGPKRPLLPAGTGRKNCHRTKKGPY